MQGQIDLETVHKKALNIYKKASQIALDNFNRQNDFEIKVDNGQKSVVTHVDKKLDAFLTNKLSEIVPGSGYISEENGVHLEREYNWIIDPLDGTANYQKGVDLWGIFISLKHGGETVYAAMLFPTLMNNLYYGIKGKGVFDQKDKKLEIKPTTGYKIKYSIDASNKEFKKQAGVVDLGFRTSVMLTGSVAFNAYSIIKGAYDFFVAYKLASYDCDAVVFLAQELGLKINFYSDQRTDEEIAVRQTQKLLICKPDIYNKVTTSFNNWLEDYEKRNN